MRFQDGGAHRTMPGLSPARKRGRQAVFRWYFRLDNKVDCSPHASKTTISPSRRYFRGRHLRGRSQFCRTVSHLAWLSFNDRRSQACPVYMGVTYLKCLPNVFLGLISNILFEIPSCLACELGTISKIALFGALTQQALSLSLMLVDCCTPV